MKNIPWVFLQLSVRTDDAKGSSVAETHGEMGGHSEIPKVPDWRIYKVEQVPELVALRRALASHPLKLKDPWLRNEVWKFVEFRDETWRRAGSRLIFSGFKIGLLAALVTAGIEMALQRGHGDHGKEGHH